MPVEPERVARARLTAFVGSGYRHLSPKYDPLSGEGARLNGGRFNPPGSFPVLYLCLTRYRAAAELQRADQRQAIGTGGLLPRHLFRYDMRLERVLDLTDQHVRLSVGVSIEADLCSDLSTPVGVPCERSVLHGAFRTGTPVTGLLATRNSQVAQLRCAGTRRCEGDRPECQRRSSRRSRRRRLGIKYATISAGKNRNRLKMKNNSQLCPFRRATRAGQKASANRMMKPTIPIPAQPHPEIAAIMPPSYRVSVTALADQLIGPSGRGPSCRYGRVWR